MYSRKSNVKSIATLCLCAGVLAGGCNVEWMRVKPEAPLGAVASPTNPARVDLPDEPIDLSVADRQEVDLVEDVLRHRALYHRGLERLRHHYEATGYIEKLGWVEFEQEGLKSVKTFRYLADAEIPSDTLRPTDRIAEADELYQQGLDLMKKGGHQVPALYHQDIMIQAAKAFRDLVKRYPTSDKIDDAAFMCGEIHKEYLPKQETLSVKWYERAWTWDPKTPHPARFQAAVVYDFRLHDRDRALELYHSVVEHEADRAGNVRFAMRRIHELTRAFRTASAGGG